MNATEAFIFDAGEDQKLFHKLPVKTLLRLTRAFSAAFAANIARGVLSHFPEDVLFRDLDIIHGALAADMATLDKILAEKSVVQKK